ncbi:hypothetical protein C6P46_001431 [Rhodotorula mucilaginosa]|uniref:Emopamil-binding protein n=1 Tax=Rhodotorula mucilaginosa TaxID=5537 RepID=A0A9P6W4E8_RHOMI|nr:hypothetical protein C6P46_001431 [Rhodotorula mucilaginosa]
MDARDRVGSSARPSNDRVGLLYTAHKCAYPNAWSVQLTLNTHVSLPTCFLDPSSLAKASLNMPPYAAPASNGYRPNRWIVAWFVVSTLLVAWDTGYMLLRPRTFPGGDLFWFWKPYVLYAKTDLVYSRAAYESKDGFAAAQSVMNVVESVLNVVFLVLAARHSPVAVLIGAIATAMTASKTVLYWLCDILSDWSMTGHNSRFDWWLLYAIPNGPWIVIPGLIAIHFYAQIAKSLRVAAKMKTL